MGRFTAGRFTAGRFVLALVVAVLALLAAGAGSASAHSQASVVLLEVVSSDGGVFVRASVHYPDNDPVEGETVVGVAYSPETRTTLPLPLAADPSGAGEYSATIRLAPGAWQIEVDAVAKTRGLQSAGFTVAADGSVVNVDSPSPLPATVVVPGAPVADSGSGLRDTPSSAVSPLAFGVIIAMAALGFVVVLVLARRQATDRAGGRIARVPEPH